MVTQTVTNWVGKRVVREVRSRVGNSNPGERPVFIRQVKDTPDSPEDDAVIWNKVAFLRLRGMFREPVACEVLGDGY